MKFFKNISCNLFSCCGLRRSYKINFVDTYHINISYDQSNTSESPITVNTIKNYKTKQTLKTIEPKDIIKDSPNEIKDGPNEIKDGPNEIKGSIQLIQVNDLGAYAGISKLKIDRILVIVRSEAGESYMFCRPDDLSLLKQLNKKKSFHYNNNQHNDDDNVSLIQEAKI